MKLFEKIFEKIATFIALALAKGAIDKTPEVLKNIAEWWNGKSIAVIGPTASGKNSMFNRFKHQAPPEEHVQTRGAEQVGKFNINWTLPDSTTFNMTCKKSINVGGELDERERYWLQSCNQADVIFYLIDGEKLVSDSEKTLFRIKDDLRWIVRQIHSFKPNVVVHLLVNKVDYFVKDVAFENSQKIISEKLLEEIKIIEDISRKILGSYFKKITGIGPISMLDDFLFKAYFTEALQQIQLANTSNQKK